MPEPQAAPTLDDETTAALTLFNEYVEADRERTQREKRVKKAERAKDEAAAAVKKLNDRGSAEEKAAAEQAYREAADRWKKLRDGEDPDDAPADTADTAADPAPTDAPPADPATDDAATDPAPTDAPPADPAATDDTPATDDTGTDEPQ